MCEVIEFRPVSSAHSQGLAVSRKSLFSSLAPKQAKRQVIYEAHCLEMKST